MAARISRFTPWLTSRADLEAMFVARQPLLDDLVNRLRHAVDSVSRQHTLIVGPRGAGKTHLLALTYYQIADLAGQAKVQLARLPEDPWTIDTYDRLLAAILTALKVADRPAGAAELEHRLEQCYAEAGVIVVIVENLDEIFKQIGNDGQRRLRHFLQTSPALLILASTPALDRSLTEQTSPFYNFFSIVHLDPLTLEQAVELVRRLAAVRDDVSLVQTLDETSAQRRLAIIEHLAGGQPRLWVTLGQILTPAGVRRLADTLVESFDDLTPYYQDRLRTLSAQQRLVVAELSLADHPLHVQDLARRTGKGEKSTARAVLELRDLGWITKVETPWDHLLDARRSYYELAEPLARLAFQVKESWGEPIRLIVEFLSYWFDPDDAADWRDEADPYMLEVVAAFEGEPTVRLVRQLSRLPESRVPDVELLGDIDDALAAVGAGDAEPMLALRTTVRRALERRCRSDGTEPAQSDGVVELRYDIHRAAMEQMGSVPHDPQSTDWIARSERLAGTAGGSSAALSLWAKWLARGWRFDEALAVGALIVAEYPLAEEWRVALGRGYRSAGRYEEAMLLDLETLMARQQVLGPEHPDTLRSRNVLAIDYTNLGRYDEALALELETLAFSERVLGPDHPTTLSSRHNLAGTYVMLGRRDEGLALYLETLAVRQRVLGPNHPDTLRSRHNLAATYSMLGQHDEALALDRETLAIRQRVLGPDHPDTLLSRRKLAIDLANLGLETDTAGPRPSAVPLGSDTFGRIRLGRR